MDMALPRLLTLWLCAVLLASQEALAGTHCLNDPARVQELRQLDEARVTEMQLRKGSAVVPPRIRTLARRLQNASEVLRHKPPVQLFGYTDAAVGAHAADHGLVLLSSGIWSGVHALTDQEIAAVLAHELAHIEMAHSLSEACAAVARMASADANLEDALSTLDSELFNASSELALAVRAQLHQRELEADARGVELLRRAGFRPQAMLRLLKTIGQAAQRQGATLGRGGHPSAELRLAATQLALRAPATTAASRLQPPARR